MSTNKPSVFIGENNQEQLVVTNANAGINTNNPTEKLEVQGNIKATAFIGDGSQLTGLTDADISFPGKPASEPIVIVFTGQSNCTGVGATTSALMPNNANVFDWRNSATGYSFVEANPTYDAFNFTGGVLYTGMAGSIQSGVDAGNPRGNIGWAAANQLQQITKRDVYMVTVHKNNTPISAWEDLGEARTELETQMAAALAVIPNGSGGVGNLKADLVIWMQGEANVQYSPDSAFYNVNNSLSPNEYAIKWQQFQASTEAENKYTTKNITRWVICSVSDFVNNSVSRGDQFQYWGGLENTVALVNQYTTFISSQSVDLLADVVHYTGAGLNEMGLRVSKSILSGVVPKETPYKRISQLFWDSIPSEILIGKTLTGNSPALPSVLEGISAIDVTPPSSAANSIGGNITVKGGASLISADAGDVMLLGGASVNGNAGQIILQAGVSSGGVASNQGTIELNSPIQTVINNIQVQFGTQSPEINDNAGNIHNWLTPSNGSVVLSPTLIVQSGVCIKILLTNPDANNAPTINWGTNVVFMEAETGQIVPPTSFPSNYLYIFEFSNFNSPANKIVGNYIGKVII